MAARKDGSVQLAFGMGKYPNRGVLDAYAGISIGKQQWTVRSSRRLAPDVERLETGPIRYEVLEPLARRAVQPGRQRRAARSASSGPSPARCRAPSSSPSTTAAATASGSTPTSSATTRSAPPPAGPRSTAPASSSTTPTSVSTRDHSWGVRYMVGAPVEDVEEAARPSSVSTTVIWSPILCERPDGSRYGIHTYYQRHGIGGWQRIELQGGIEHPDGRREPWAALVPHAEVDDATRRLSAAQLDFTMADGSARPITVTAVGDTGFHLGTGLYFGFDGHWHGEWRGDLHVDGEHLADCTDPDTAHRIHQMRDNLVRLDDPVGGGVGYGNLQSIFAGPHPDLGLTEEASFL